MKLHYIAAATLLLGTSAFAWAPSTEPAARDVKDPVAALDPGAPMEPKLAHVMNKTKPVEQSWNTEQPKPQPASLATWDDQAEPAAAGLDLDLADNPDAIDAVEPATTDVPAADTGLKLAGDADLAAVQTADASIAAADLAPRPAAQNYPPCAPGPGDDNCIQLYEPGVRTALAGWNQPTGGLMDGQATTAMGGPYEPVAGEQPGVSAMNGDGIVDSAAGETADLEAALAQ